jgi:spore germination protein GerM
MAMKYIIILIMIALLLCFPQRAHAVNTHNAYYLIFDDQGVNSWVFTPGINGQDTEDIASGLLHELFSIDRADAYAYPEGTGLLSAYMTNGHLALDITLGNRGYGGAYIERVYILQMLRTVLSLDTVSSVTITVDGDIHGFCEGTVVREVVSWLEWTEGVLTS